MTYMEFQMMKYLKQKWTWCIECGGAGCFTKGNIWESNYYSYEQCGCCKGKQKHEEQVYYLISS